MAATNIDVLNTIWDNASTHYQDRIPQATRDNITAVGDAITSYTPAMNEFLNALVNRISLTIVSSKMAKNRLAQFKKGMIEYGSDIEEIFTSMAEATTYDPATAETQVFQRVLPDTKAIFHRINRQDKYKTTINKMQLQRAFLSNDGLGKLVSSIVNSLYSGDAYDEYVLMKELFAQYKPNFKYQTVTAVSDQSTAQNFFRSVRALSQDFTFMSNEFNAQGVMQMSDVDDQVLILHKDVNTFLDVDLLAWVFHRDNVDFKTKVVVVDDFGSLSGVMGALVDKNWFMVYDKVFETESLYNPEGRYWNYWLHHHQILSTSQFQNAVLLTDSTFTP